ncbi:MAG: tetratricopeptide repeat protein, partial [Acidobacteriota bacterium]
LAETLRALGDIQGARELHEQALDARRRVLGAEHPDTLISINNLAATLSALGNAEGARDLCEQALDVRHRVLGAEHPSTLISLHNLLCVIQEAGERVDSELVNQLVESVRKLPEGTPIRRAAEAKWVSD